MTIAQTNELMPRRPLRLWPGVAAVALQWLVRFAVPIVFPGSGGTAILGGLAGGLAVIVWWLFFSRAPWSERVGAIVLMVAALFATSRIVHESIADGMMGMMLPIFAIPVLSLALVASVAAGRRLASGPRRALMVAAILLACGTMTLLRTGGLTGDANSDLHWRWTRTPEERLLAQTDEPAAPASAPAAVEASEEGLVAPAGNRPVAVPSAPGAVTRRVSWPGFRGPGRDSIIRGVRIETDWSRTPPVELWRRPIGPGWSSFAVRGNLLYTQEQRGDDEIVASYNLTNGKPVWKHRDSTRFWESNGGAGPRATPTLSGGRVYTFGATGILNALDADDGAVVWSRNVASDTGAMIPGWGFASSPLVVDDLVIVHADALVAYDRATGNRRWLGPARGGGYSSPHPVTIDGVAQIVQLSEYGATSIVPADGTLLWEHAWPGVPIVQPALVATGDLLISTAGTTGAAGTRRIAVAHGPGGWTVEERWTSIGLKPYFNDFVVHDGHAFGFDGSILACIALEDGKRTTSSRRWRDSRRSRARPGTTRCWLATSCWFATASRWRHSGWRLQAGDDEISGVFAGAAGLLGACSGYSDTLLVLDVLRHAPQCGFRCVQIASGVDGDAFSHGAVGRIRLVGRNEHRHLAVRETPDPDPPEPSRVNLLGRLRVGGVNDIVLVDGQPADAAEVVVFAQ
jgi:outer membrane protein assembly factor BamB